MLLVNEIILKIMLRYQLIISDIDGTLLNKARDVDPVTIKEIRRVSANYHIPIVLASGRMSKGMHKIKRDIGLIELPMISYNGALIQGALNPDGSSETLFSKTFSAEIGLGIYKMGKENGVEIGLYSFDDWHVEQIDRWAQHEIDHTKIDPVVTNNEATLRNWQTQKKGLHKIMLIGETALIDPLEIKLRAKYNNDLQIYRSNRFIIEVCPSEVTKCTATQFLNQYMNLLPQFIMAFGDNLNDKEMLEYVGTGIAVANAKPPVKAIADDLTDSNVEFGVANALQKYFK